MIDETLYISKTKYKVPYDLTLSFVKTSVLPYAQIIHVEEPNLDVAGRYLSKYGEFLKPSDAIHLATMEKEGILHIATEDGEFDRITEVKRIWGEPK